MRILNNKREKDMKKKLALILSVIMLIVSFTACSSSRVGPANDTNAKASSDGTKGPTKPNKALAQKNGPQVTAVYLEKGETVKETFSFSEVHPYFTDEDMTWILDLCGNTVTLATVLVLDTNVSIVNGTIKTADEAYIENNRSFSAGEMESYQFQPLLLDSDGLGIQNNGDLYLRSLEMAVNTGIGIMNAGTVCRADSGSDNHYSAYKVLLEGSAGTTCLKNSGELNFGTININSSGGTVLHNEATGIVYTYAGGEYTVTNGTAILNYGSIKREKSDTYDYYCHECTVNGGYAIENYGSLYHVMNINMTEGTAIRNYPEGSFASAYDNNPDNNTNSVFNITMESGTAVYNEGNARLDNIDINMTKGCALDNYGVFTPGNLNVSVQSGNLFTGTIINNHKGAYLEGLYCLKADTTKDAVLLQNDGVIRNNCSFDIRCGYTKTTDQYGGPIDAYNPFAICENTCLVKNSNQGLISEASFRMTMAGTGEGEYVGFFNEPGAVMLAEILDIYINMYCNKGIGICNGAESILGLTDSDIERYCGSQVFIGNSEDDRVNEYEFELYRVNNVTFSPAGNTGIYNDGTIKRYNINNTISGQDNQGILNNHAIEGDSIYIQLMGSDNVGIQNEGSIHALSAYADVCTSGDGTGINNNGNLYVTGLGVKMENAISAGHLLGLNNKGLIESKAMTSSEGLTNEARLTIENYVDDSVGMYNSGQIHCDTISGGVSGYEAVGILNDESGFIEVATDMNCHTFRKNNIGLANSGSVNVLGNASFHAYNPLYTATISDDAYSENTLAAKIESSGRLTAENINVYSHGSNTGLSNYGYVCAKNLLSLIDYYENHVDACYIDRGGILTYHFKETKSKEGLQRFEGN